MKKEDKMKVASSPSLEIGQVAAAARPDKFETS